MTDEPDITPLFDADGSLLDPGPLDDEPQEPRIETPASRLLAIGCLAAIAVVVAMALILGAVLR